MSAEFDRYAGHYEDLLRDPIRDRFAASAEFFHFRKWRLIQDFFRRRSIRSQELGWLDVGCGKGELLRLGNAHFRAAMGCDPSAEMLRQCGGLRVSHQPQPTRLPFDDQSFDFVTAACVYHHLAPGERPALTNEARRVLRPGGLFAIFEHNPWNPVTRLIVGRTPVDASAVLLRARESRGLMRAAGLVPLDTLYYLYLPQRLFELAGGLERLLAGVPFGGQYAVFGEKHPVSFETQTNIAGGSQDA
jgi:SAM-dependent methyltransferase